jgi:iron-sulfur cluster assembly protein
MSNEVISEIKVTSKAAKEIKKVMEENNIPMEFGLRVGVKGGGCSGLSYALGFDSVRDGDTVIDAAEIKLLVDGESLFYLTGTELDYTDGLNGRGFVFNNPNAVKTCGCGNSFSA